MQRSTKAILITIISLAILATAGISVFSLNSHTDAQNTVQTTKEASQPPTISEMLRLVNEERNRVGVEPLVEDARLDQSAQWKADDMFKYNYFGHISPNDGKHGYEYINDVNISCKTDSENLVGAKTAQAAFDWWINSPAHHEAMISANYSLTGFGITYVKDIPVKKITASNVVTSDLTDSYVVVEHFCQQ